MERMPTNENKSETFPTKEKVVATIESCIEKRGTVVRMKEDEQGVVSLVYQVMEGGTGEFTEYSYDRKGTHPADSKTAIFIDYYSDGIPIGGDVLAEFTEDGEIRKI